jgi:hypothetical protein
MNTILHLRKRQTKCIRYMILSAAIICALSNLNSFGQNPSTTFIAGAYIIDMGQPTQTIKNGLKPYGLVYQLIITAVTPVNWAINSSKVKDGIDFTASTSAGSKSYSGGSFIISSEYITASVITLINTWKTEGVVVDGPTVGSFTAPVYKELTSWPIGVLDEQNDGIIKPYYENAGIPSTSYIKNADPTMLNGCTGGDLYVLPHADPNKWIASWVAALQNYINNGGYVWAGCHAVSELENIPGCNFLSNNGLVPYDDHNDENGNPTYTYNTSSVASPIMQFIGAMDVASANGSEQIYVPGASGWRSTTTQAVYSNGYINTKPNPDVAYTYPNSAIVLAYGPAFGDINKGMVMYEAGHNLDNVNPVCQRVAAQRAFFNFILMAGAQRQIALMLTPLPDFYTSGETYSLSATATGGTSPYTYLWSCDNGGTFSSTTSMPTNYTAPLSVTPVIIKLKVTDACGRVNFSSVKWGNPLPIELLSFDAKPDNGFVDIAWTTLSETNNDYFTIEKTKDAISYETIKNIDGAGNSNILLNYSAKDNEPFSGVSYYRLKQTDFDGKFSYSNIVSVDFEKSQGVTIYPNPFSTFAAITINDASQINNYELRIYNVLGTVVMNTILTEQNTAIETSILPAGIYSYNILKNDKNIQSGKLISQQ